MMGKQHLPNQVVWKGSVTVFIFGIVQSQEESRFLINGKESKQVALGRPPTAL